jgi:hypothetical protein
MVAAYLIVKLPVIVPVELSLTARCVSLEIDFSNCFSNYLSPIYDTGDGESWNCSQELSQSRIPGYTESRFSISLQLASV